MRVVKMKKIKGRYLLLVAVLAVAAILAGCSTDGGGNSTPVDLDTAVNFAILAKAAITNTTQGASVITGDVGVSAAAATFITGFALTMDGSGQFSTTPEVVGLGNVVYASDYAPPTPAMLTAAILDMENAYLDAEGRTNPDATELGAGEIGGLTLAPGLYKWGTGLLISTDVHLSGSGVYIFQIASTLTVAAATDVLLENGADPADIFWQVGSAATIGSTANFKGTILAKTAITIGTGAIMDGRAFAQTAVTIDDTNITLP